MMHHSGTVVCLSEAEGPEVRRRRGFTLIELLVVVVVIAIISGLLLPVFIQAADRARRADITQAAARSEQMRADTNRSRVPTGPVPIVDSVAMNMALASSYHRLAMDVFTRFRVDCKGRIVFRRPDSSGDPHVMLVIPFPDNSLDVRDVQLKVFRPDTTTDVTPTDVVYNKRGIYCSLTMDPAIPLAADVSFTALGREQFDYALPPARQLRSVAITLDLTGTDERTVPDDSLQPTFSSPTRLRWEFQNLVSDRQITVRIPGAQAPLARMLLLSRLVALAVLLFGTGFGYLSEQAKPGQLRGFRLGHFLLLALTYSLFFVIFGVLEFHGGPGTPVSMGVAALFSLPLLVLHVSRVLSLRFAVTRVVPLAIFTTGLVVNGVYGGPVRDYVFIGAAIFVITFLTLTFPSWAAGRERYRQEQEAAYALRRRALAETIMVDLGTRIGVLSGAGARATEYARSAQDGELAEGASRLQRAWQTVSGLVKEYEELEKRLSYVPERPSLDSSESCSNLERSASVFGDRLEQSLAYLQAEIAAFQSMLRSQATPAGSAETHCPACGHEVPDAPFCQVCGAARPIDTACPGCGNHVMVPVHLISDERQSSPVFCNHCGTWLLLVPADGVIAPQDSDKTS